MWPGRSASGSEAAFPGGAVSSSEPGQTPRQQRDTHHQGLKHSTPRQDPKTALTSWMRALRPSQKMFIGLSLQSAPSPGALTFLRHCCRASGSRCCSSSSRMSSILPVWSSGWVLGHHAHTFLTHTWGHPHWEAFLPGTLAAPLTPILVLWMPHRGTDPCTPGPHLSQHRYSWDLRSSFELCTWKPRRASCRSPGQPARTKSWKGPQMPCQRLSTGKAPRPSCLRWRWWETRVGMEPCGAGTCLILERWGHPARTRVRAQGGWMDWGMQRGLTSMALGGERRGREGSERIYSTVEKRNRGPESPGKETERSGGLEAKSREWGLGQGETRV